MRIFLCLLPLLFSSVAQAIGLPMRKLALGIVALICVAALPATARAADIPSSASGDYVGGGGTADSWPTRIRCTATRPP